MTVLTQRWNDAEEEKSGENNGNKDGDETYNEATTSWVIGKHLGLSSNVDFEAIQSILEEILYRKNGRRKKVRKGEQKRLSEDIYLRPGDDFLPQ